ncbi:hypothetical protein [Candidatus Binatus soli]|jgi:hypothetical protein|uniref:hypothetical protein n=1 Tax=Candidatus Binatus soli TaxID=1953413 RepID=UPI003D1131AD
MIRYALVAAAAVFAVGCNSSPLQTADNTVGGANVVSSAETPMAKGATSLSLDWGAKAQAGQVAIADVLSYGGSKTTISAPAGWQPIRDDSTPTTRQSLYWHAIQANDARTATWTFSEPVDAQGAILLLDNAAAAAPVDMSNVKTGNGGTVHSDSMTTTADGDLILIFKATDFGNAPLQPQIPGDMSAVVAQGKAPLEYWILATWQSQNGATEETEFSFPQLFNWTAAQVAIKHGSH